MTSQPEPDGGAWQDSYGIPWMKSFGLWITVGNGDRLSWQRVLQLNNGQPLVPLVPDPGWQSDGEPVVCRVVRTASGESLALRTPSSEVLTAISVKEAHAVGLPVPPEPEPSLADLQTELANVIAAGTGYLPEDDDIIDLLSRLAARLRELERKVESAGRDAYRVATLYENDDSSIRWTSDKSYEVGNEPPNYQSATSESQSSSKLDGEGDGIDCGSRSDLLPPRSPSPLPERTYHGMDEKAVREWASAWEMQAWTCRDYMIRDACRAKVAEWDSDPDLVPVMLSHVTGAQPLVPRWKPTPKEKRTMSDRPKDLVTEDSKDKALADCPSCGADWKRTEIVSEANRGAGYRMLCHECGHKWDDHHASHHVRETARRREAMGGMDESACPKCGSPDTDDTDAIDWDVLYGHSTCTEPGCTSYGHNPDSDPDLVPVMLSREVAGDLVAWAEALEANVGNHCTVMSVGAQRELAELLRRALEANPGGES